MALWTKQASSAKTSLAYLTIGAMLMVWTTVYCFWSTDPSPVGFWTVGFFLTGLTLTIIGAGVGAIGREAMKSEVAPTTTIPVATVPAANVVAAAPSVPAATTATPVNGNGNVPRKVVVVNDA